MCNERTNERSNSLAAIDPDVFLVVGKGKIHLTQDCSDGLHC